MIEIRTTGYRKIREIHGLMYYINVPQYAMKDLCISIFHGNDIKTIPYTTFLFSGVVSSRYAEDFKDYIEKEKLGDVISTVSKRNPNSGNTIRAYVWTIDKEALIKWILKQ